MTQISQASVFARAHNHSITQGSRGYVPINALKSGQITPPPGQDDRGPLSGRHNSTIAATHCDTKRAKARHQPWPSSLESQVTTPHLPTPRIAIIHHNPQRSAVRVLGAEDRGCSHEGTPDAPTLRSRGSFLPREMGYEGDGI